MAENDGKLKKENVLDSDENVERIQECLVICSEAMGRIQTERNFIKDTVKDLADDLGIPKKTINKMIKTYYKKTFEQEVEEQDEFEEIYQKVVA